MAVILIAEGHGPLRSLLASVLTSAGFEVIEACDAGGALDVGKQTSPPIDLLCANMAMERMGGAVLAENLRHQCPGMKVLLLVTENPRYVVVDTPEIATNDQCYSVLRKPFTIEQFVQRVEQMLKPIAASGQPS